MSPQKVLYKKRSDDSLLNYAFCAIPTYLELKAVAKAILETTATMTSGIILVPMTPAITAFKAA